MFIAVKALKMLVTKINVDRYSDIQEESYSRVSSQKSYHICQSSKIKNNSNLQRASGFINNRQAYSSFNLTAINLRTSSSYFFKEFDNESKDKMTDVRIFLKE